MKYSELSEQAKQKAIDEFARRAFTDAHDWEYVFTNAVEIGKLLGIEIDTRRHSTEPVIYFSGFSSQDDGACFEGSYRYKKGALQAVKAHAPHDTELLRIAKALQDVQRKHFYALVASMSHRGHYYHSGCMSVSVEDSRDSYRDIGDAEDDITQLMREFADWIYRQLENEYEYQTSREAIEENIDANEYEFDEDGDII